MQTLATKSSSADHSKLTRPVDEALLLLGRYVDLRASDHRSPQQAGEQEERSGGDTQRIGDAGTDELYADQQHQRQLHIDTADLKATSTPEREMWFDLLPADAEHASTPWEQRATPLSTVLTQIETAIAECAPAAERLDLYAEASSLGHTQSLYRWSMLMGFGAEISNLPCGIEDFPAPRAVKYHEVNLSPSNIEEYFRYAGQGGGSAVFEAWKRELETLATEDAVSDQVGLFPV